MGVFDKLLSTITFLWVQHISNYASVASSFRLVFGFQSITLDWNRLYTKWGFTRICSHNCLLTITITNNHKQSSVFLLQLLPLIHFMAFKNGPYYQEHLLRKSKLPDTVHYKSIFLYFNKLLDDLSDIQICFKA